MKAVESREDSRLTLPLLDSIDSVTVVDMSRLPTFELGGGLSGSSVTDKEEKDEVS